MDTKRCDGNENEKSVTLPLETMTSFIQLKKIQIQGFGAICTSNYGFNEQIEQEHTTPLYITNFQLCQTASRAPLSRCRVFV